MNRLAEYIKRMALARQLLTEARQLLTEDKKTMATKPESIRAKNAGTVNSTKHTPTPFKELFGRGLRAKDNLLFADFFIGYGSTKIPPEIVTEKIGAVNSVEQVEYISRAVNAYDKNQETIRALYEILEKMHCAINLGDANQRENSLDALKLEIRQAIAQAEGE